MTEDTFAGRGGTVDSNARNAAAITPSDATDLTYVTRGIWVGGAGNISVEMVDTGTVVFSGVQAGTILPLRVSRVNSTSTTASNLVALW